MIFWQLSLSFCDSQDAVHYPYRLFHNIKETVDEIYSVEDEEDDLPPRDDCDAIFKLIQERNLIQPVSYLLALSSRWTNVKRQFWEEFKALINKHAPKGPHYYADYEDYEDRLGWQSISNNKPALVEIFYVLHMLPILTSNKAEPPQGV